jgi:SSS family transporter
MNYLDWIVLSTTVLFIVLYGTWKTRKTVTMEGYLKADNTMKWWMIGASIMATQASAITFLSTTGQGMEDGMRFIQFYFGLPIAMVILCVTLVPFFYRAQVFTAYEYLERRFDVKTRTLTSFLFLMQRGMSMGVTLYAPSLVLSTLFGLPESLTILVMGGSTILYVMKGGNKSVIWTDVVQMAVVWTGIFTCFYMAIHNLPEHVSYRGVLAIAQASGRLNATNLDTSLETPYTLWSGLIGGLFLMLSYFGCDQSQVQRYLTAKSVDDGRTSLLMSAFWKIPLQVLVLIVGVFTFLFYLFNQPPLLFNPVHEERVRVSAVAPVYEGLQREFQSTFAARRQAAIDIAAARRAGDVREQARATDDFTRQDAALRSIRTRAIGLVRQTTDDASFNDVNYVFPTWITTALPIGIVGLWIAAIITAATDSIAAELNSLSTASVIDFYKRLVRPNDTDAHYLLVSRIATGFWGVFAGVIAVYASSLGPLIEVVNRFGSFFYGSILGVFMLAILTRRATGTGAFVGLVAGMSSVAAVAYFRPEISFLWHNVIGAVVVLAVGLTLSLFYRSSGGQENLRTKT